MLIQWHIAEYVAALVTLKHLLEKNVKCRNLLENDAGGGSLSGSIAVRLPLLNFKLAMQHHRHNYKVEKKPRKQMLSVGTVYLYLVYIEYHPPPF